MDNKHDVLILGGGPSGLSTVLHLVQTAPQLASRILILEKEHYPRLGLDVSEARHVDVDNAHFDFAGKGITVCVPKKHAIRVICRDEFDTWLAKKAEE